MTLVLYSLTMESPLKALYADRRAAFLVAADDYAAHASRVNRRLAKAKKNLRIHSRDTKNYTKKQSNDPKYADVLLLTAERDLLHAQQAKVMLDAEPNRARSKFVVGKLERALKTGYKLLDFTTDVEDQYQLLEYLGYVAIIEGSLAISKKKYQNAIYPLSVVRCILQCIHSTKDSNDVYYDTIDTIVDPSLKLACSQGLNLKPSDMGSISKEFASKGAETATQSQLYLRRAVELVKAINPAYITPSSDPETMLIDSITWSEYTATVKNEDVALAIMKANEGEQHIAESEPSSFDKALLAYDDAIILQEEQIERQGKDESEENQEEHIVLTYVKYNSFLLKIRRDLALLDGISANAAEWEKLPRQSVLGLLRDSLKLIDGVAIYVKDLKELPGVANVDDIYDSLVSLEVYFQIQKLNKISQGYLISNRYKEALALVDRGSTLIAEMKDLKTEFGGNLPTNESLNHLKTEIESQVKKLVVLTSYFSGSKGSSKKEYVIDNYKKFPLESSEELLKTVAPLGVDIQAVNVKPVLFDIAFNYLQYDSEAPAAAVEESVTSGGSEEEKKKGSFFGIFGRS